MHGYYHDIAIEDGSQPTGFRAAGLSQTQPRVPRRFAQVAVGDVLPPLVQGPLTVTQLVKYAGASCDFNPIHHDEAYAKRTPGGGIIANGVMVMGFMSKCAVAWLGTANFSRLRARNLAMVRPGDTLLIEGRVLDLVPLEEGGAGTVRIGLKASNQATGVVVCSGEVSCVLG